MNKDYVYKRRLLKLADFLSTVPRKRFNFKLWVGNDWGGKPDLSCGTTACALGWATTIPAFRKAGLRLIPKRSDYNLKFMVGLKTKSVIRHDPYFAGKKVFDLKDWEFESLFVPKEQGGSLPGTATPKQVAAKIRKFVSHKYNNP